MNRGELLQRRLAAPMISHGREPDGSPEPVPDMPERLPAAAAADGKKRVETKKEKSKIDSRAGERTSPQHYYNYYTGRH